MPSLGFSIENSSRRNSPAEIRRTRRQVEKQSNFGGFVVGMIGFGLILLAAAACQDQARLLAQRIVGF